MGRHSEYDKETALAICSQLANNISLRKICQQEEMPCIQTVYNWLDANDEFMEQYRKARYVQHDIQAELVADLPFDCEREGLDASYTKLKMDGLKWASSKGNPKKYGDRTIHAGDEDSPIKINHTSEDADILKRYVESQK